MDYRKRKEKKTMYIHYVQLSTVENADRNLSNDWRSVFT